MRHLPVALSVGLLWSLILGLFFVQAVAGRLTADSPPAMSKPATATGHATRPMVVPPAADRLHAGLGGRPWVVAFVNFRDIFDLGKWIYGAVGTRTGIEQLSDIENLEREQADARAALEELQARADEQQQELAAAESRLAATESRLAAALRTATLLGYVTFMLGLSVVLQFIFSVWSYGARRFAEGRLIATQDALDETRERLDATLGVVLEMATSSSQSLESRRSLADELREGKRLPEGDVVALIAPLMNALEEIHSRNKVYRNITPDTVLLPAGGDPWAFGRLRSDSREFAPLHCHEPEADQGPWTDIRALGQTVYQALTGEETDGRLELQRESGSGPLSRVSPTLRRGIEAALSADANVGPRNVGEWRRLLPAPGEVEPIDEEPDEPQGALAWSGFGMEQEVSTDTGPGSSGPWRLLLRYRLVGATLLLTVAATFMPDWPRRTVGLDGSGGPEQPLDQAVRAAEITTGAGGGGEGGMAAKGGVVATKDIESEASLWQSLTDAPSIEGVAEYLRKWPGGNYVEATRELRLSDCGECPELVVVRLQTFEIGPAGRRREVGLAGLLAVGKYEITLQQWRECVNVGMCKPLDQDKIKDNRPRTPVMGVSWDDTQDYVNWLSQRTKERYRLLSEAEWEYVARAGTSGPWFWGSGDDEWCEYANGSGCGDRGAWIPERPRKPNPFGLYDMLGNVREWTADCWRADHDEARADAIGAEQTGVCEGNERVLRGGAWHDGLDDLRVTRRFHEPADERDDRGRFAGYDAGFRVAREIGSGGEPSQ